MIPLNQPVWNKEMQKAALNALNNEKYVLGESVFKFEEEFAKYIGVDYAIGCSSGTMAEWLLLQAIKPKTVVVPDNTFHTVASVVRLQRRQLQLGDVDEQNACMESVTFGKTGKTCVIATHLYGNLCKTVTHDYAKKVLFIEDCSQAAGLNFKEKKKAGSVGFAGFFSLYTTKNLSCLGDGGIITTNDKKLAKTVRSIGNCGRDLDRRHIQLGITSRLNTVNAAIARVQLKYLDKWNLHRQKLRDLYAKNLPPTHILSQGVCYQMVIRLNDASSRLNFMNFLKERGIQTSIHYPTPIHLQKPFRKIKAHCPIAEDLSNRIVSLPMSPKLTKKEVLKVCESIWDWYYLTENGQEGKYL